MKTASLSILILALLAACTPMRDYKAPAVDPHAPQAYDVSADAYAAGEPVEAWWQAFDDAELNQLVERALEQNRTLAQARANVDRAYAVFRGSSRPCFTSIN